VKVLIFIEGLPGELPKLEFCNLIASYIESQITLLYILPENQTREEGEGILTEASTVFDMPVERCLSRGTPINVILDEVIDGGYDLVVLLACSETWVIQADPLCKAILRQIPGSVMVVKAPKKEIKNLLICTGGFDNTGAVIETGARLAQAAQAKVTLLHVAGAIPSMYTGLQNIEETLATLLQTDTPIARNLRSGAEVLEKYKVKAELKLRHGVAVDEIIREANLEDIDMILLGASGVSLGLRAWLMGNVTEAVINVAEVPVLVVNPKEAASQKGVIF
jgi:nucleotide-binding universal stress UspA family protein